MTPSPRVESRIAALISAYADRAPVDLDADALLLVVRGRPAPRGPVAWFALGGPRLGVALLVLTLLISLLTGILVLGAEPFPRGPEDVLLQRAIVPPFRGLPPIDAPASDPETGVLELAFCGRVDAIHHDLHRMSVYADGRLVWKRNLDGLAVGDAMDATDRRAFGDAAPTSAVIEQRLTPAGVELLRAKVLSRGLVNVRVPGDDGCSNNHVPGVLWGGLVMRPEGERLAEADWLDRDLPAELADPGAWLPPGAWRDRRVAGYVPSRYAICWPGAAGGAIDLARIDALLREAPLVDGCGNPSGRSVSVEVARDIVSMLEADPRIERDGDTLEFRVTATDRWIDILPVLPDGGGVCFCG